MRKQRDQQEPSDDLALEFLMRRHVLEHPVRSWAIFCTWAIRAVRAMLPSPQIGRRAPILKVVRNRRSAGICISRPELYPQKVFGG